MVSDLLNSKRISVFGFDTWQPAIAQADQLDAINKLEQGKVLFFPDLRFICSGDEQALLNPALVNPKTKNISFNFNNGELRGTLADMNQQTALKALLQRYAEHSVSLIQHLLPHYRGHLEMGRTSLRVVEVAERQAPSYRKDDTRLHIDAFPATPNQGRRLLRVFCNIHPDNKTRVWRLGEPFTEVARRFMPLINKPLPGNAWLLQKLKITKGRRTHYDHYMLNIHDKMKADLHYQRSVDQEEVHFPNRTWIVFTDQASHAALAGQHMLEQTFYLPVSGLLNPEQSPLRILEKITGQLLT